MLWLSYLCYDYLTYVMIILLMLWLSYLCYDYLTYVTIILLMLRLSYLCYDYHISKENNWFFFTWKYFAIFFLELWSLWHSCWNVLDLMTFISNCVALYWPLELPTIIWLRRSWDWRLVWYWSLENQGELQNIVLIKPSLGLTNVILILIGDLVLTAIWW